MSRVVAAATIAPFLFALASLATALRPLADLSRLEAPRTNGVLHALAYLLLALALAEPARRRRDGWWYVVLLLGLLPLASALVPARPGAPPTLLPFVVWIASPLALVLAAARWMRARGETMGGVARVLLGLFAVALVVQIASNPVLVSQGRDDLYAYNVIGVATTSLLLGAILALGDEGRPRLRKAGARLGFAGAAVAAGSMVLLLALDGLRPTGGLDATAFAAHALGRGALLVGLACVVLALARGAKAHDEAASMGPRALV